LIMRQEKKNKTGKREEKAVKPPPPKRHSKHNLSLRPLKGLASHQAGANETWN